MSNEYDNRRSFRISENVYLKADKLTDEEYARGLEHRKLQLGTHDGVQAKLIELDARLGEALYHVSREGDAVGRCLLLMNEKIDLAISELPSLRQRRSALASETPQRCDLSADGIVYSSAEPLDIGDKVHLQFLLSEDSRFVECFAEVVRLMDPPDDNEAFRYGIGLEFSGMRPEQREMLIQHMFMHETQALRMRRLQLDQQD